MKDMKPIFRRIAQYPPSYGFLSYFAKAYTYAEGFQRVGYEKDVHWGSGFSGMTVAQKAPACRRASGRPQPGNGHAAITRRRAAFARPDPADRGVFTSRAAARRRSPAHHRVR